MPDLTPCDYLLWKYLKDLEYRELPTKMEELKNKVSEAIQTIDESKIEESLQIHGKSFTFHAKRGRWSFRTAP